MCPVGVGVGCHVKLGGYLCVVILLLIINGVIFLVCPVSVQWLVPDVIHCECFPIVLTSLWRTLLITCEIKLDTTGALPLQD